MRIFTLIFLICAAGCLEASEIKVTPLPDTGVSDKFGGVTNMNLVSATKTITAWRVIFADHPDGPPTVVTNRFTKPGPGILVPTNLVAQITSILLDRHSYCPPDMKSSCIYEPDYFVTFSDGRKNLDVIFCTHCSVMLVRYKNGSFETVDSLIESDAAAQLSHILQQVFPSEDEP